MKRRDQARPDHPQNPLKRRRRQRRRRKLHSMLLAGAALVVPRAGNQPAPSRSGVAAEAINRAEPVLVGEVTTSTIFRLPPEIAYEALIQEAAQRFGLDPALIRAVIRTESAFDALAVSSVGAQGLMQLMPELAATLGVTDSFDPRANIMAGSEYLSALLATYDGDIELALAGYNAGPGAVDQYNGIPPFEETRRYVKTIMELMARGKPAP